MAATHLTTQWSMVINNPDENDYALVRNGYPDHVRELVWTTEVGEEGTEHIQAYIKLQRSQRMSFVKKLFPKAHFKPIDKDEYALNTRRYAQKDDDTTAGAHRQSYNDPIPAADTLLYQIVEGVLEDKIEDLKIAIRKGHENDFYGNTKEEYLQGLIDDLDPDNMPTIERGEFCAAIKFAEHTMVRTKKHMEKLLVSPTYTRIKKEWLWDIVARIYKHAYDHACLEQDTGREVVEVDLPSTEDNESDSQGDEDSLGSQDSDSEQDSQDGD